MGTTEENQATTAQMEEQAAKYTDMLGEKIDRIVITDAEHSKKRYDPWLEKALVKMNHSKHTWATQKRKNNAKKNENQNQEPTVYKTIWEAAVAGSVPGVQGFVEEEGKDIRAHNSADGGGTVLHYACWHGHLELVKYVIEYCDNRFGTNTRCAVVNAIDTCYYRSTPLLEACRNNQGFLNDRLALIKLLVASGADVEHQNAHGDNALHWAARRSYLPIVRFLLTGTDGAVFASLAENHKRKKPIDIAQDRMQKKSTMTTLEVFALLQKSARGCNIRLKIQQGKKMRLSEKADVENELKAEALQVIDSARVLSESVDEMLMEAHKQAQEHQMKGENIVVQEALEKAREEATSWWNSTEGKAFAKEKAPVAAEEIRALLKSGEIKKKPKDLKKAAAARVKEKYFMEKESAAAEAARDAYRKDNPPVESFEVLTKALAK